MSLPNWNIDASSNKLTNTYFKGYVDISGGDVILRNGKVRSVNNTIEFDDVYSFINIPNNFHCFGQQKILYNSIDYDVGERLEKIQDIYDNKIGSMGYYQPSDFNTFNNIYCNGQIQYLESGTGNHVDLVPKVLSSETSVTNLLNKTTNISYSSSTNTTTIDGLLALSANSINSTSINNTSFVDLTNAQTVGGIKRFTANVRMDSALLVNAGATTISNISLGYVSGLTSSAQTQLTNLGTRITTVETKTTPITYTAATVTTVISGVLQFTGTLNGWSTTNFSNAINYSKDLTSSAQTQLNTLTTNVSTLQTNSVSLSANNVFTGSNSFNGSLNSTTFNSNVQISGGFGALYNNAVQFVFYPSQTTFSNGVAGENVFEFTANNTDRGLTVQGGKGSDGRSLFGMYYLSGSFANSVNRTPIMYGRDTGSQSTNVLTIASGTLATTNLTFSGNINSSFTKSQFDNAINYAKDLTSSAQTQISTLITKLTDTTYSGSITTVANTLSTAKLTFSETLNNISTTTFGYLSGLSGSIQSQLNSLSTRIATFEIVGTIIMSPLNDLQTTTGNKYLMCNGQEVSRTTYSELFAKFGTLFGVGDGSTTFNLPNYNGMFLRGMGTQVINGTTYGNYNSTYAPDQDSVQDHTHAGQAGSYLGSLNSTQSIGYRPQSSSAPNSYNFTTTGAMNSGRINAFETKPVSIGIYYYVKI